MIVTPLHRGEMKTLEIRRRGKAKKKERKRRAREAYRGPLKELVEFVNLDINQARSDNISGELHRLIHNDLSLGSLENLKILQTEILEALSPIAEPPAGFTRARMQVHLNSLIDKIHRLHFEPRFIPLAGGQKLFGLANPARQLLNREQGVFSRGAGEWIVRLEFSVGPGYAPERDFYASIAEGLVSGELTMLRRCPYCRIFFVAKESRQLFCAREHGRLYYDDPTRAKERVYKSRASS
jgi:hypothetical protein